MFKTGDRVRTWSSFHLNWRIGIIIGLHTDNLGVDPSGNEMATVRFDGEDVAIKLHRLELAPCGRFTADFDDQDDMDISESIIEPSNAEFILSAIRTDVEYLAKQLRMAQEATVRGKLDDCLTRAMDALERIQSNLTTTAVLPSEWTTQQILDREA